MASSSEGDDVAEEDEGHTDSQATSGNLGGSNADTDAEELPWPSLVVSYAAYPPIQSDDDDADNKESPAPSEYDVYEDVRCTLSDEDE